VCLPTRALRSGGRERKRVHDLRVGGGEKVEGGHVDHWRVSTTGARVNFAVVSRTPVAAFFSDCLPTRPDSGSAALTGCSRGAFRTCYAREGGTVFLTTCVSDKVLCSLQDGENTALDALAIAFGAGRFLRRRQLPRSSERRMCRAPGLTRSRTVLGASSLQRP
jgi:hypothetical protein